MESQNVIVAQASDIDRADFYRKTYMHVAFAILAFMAVETLLLKIVPAEWIMSMMQARMGWLLILGLFWLGSSFSNNLVFNPSKDKQYMGLALYVVLEAIIFLPMIQMAIYYSGGGQVISEAALLTLFMFAGLTAVVFFTNTDFSFLRTVMTVGGFLSIGIIIVGMLFHFELGFWFSVLMVALASASILYQTNQIKTQFATDQYVGAALQLFSSVMLLFWYILRILMSRRR